MGSTTGCTATTGDVFGTNSSPINPQLGPLQDNGGNTVTHALLSGSPAIDAADASACPATDQRGFHRSGTCDMGTYAFNGAAMAPFQSYNFAMDLRLLGWFARFFAYPVWFAQYEQ